MWFATHFLFGAHWTPASLPIELPALASLDLNALALSAAAGVMLRFGLAPTLVVCVGAGLVLRLL